jgi:hypothetical protein
MMRALAQDADSVPVLVMKKTLYEVERDERVARNKKALESLVTVKLPVVQPRPVNRAPRAPRAPRAVEPPRRSARSEGKQVDYKFDIEIGERKPRGATGPRRYVHGRYTLEQVQAMSPEELAAVRLAALPPRPG